MLMWLIWGLVGTTLTLLFLVGGLGLSKLNSDTREFLSPLECGFSTNQDGRQPVSLRFFIYAVVFVVFDVELVLVIPLLYKFPLILGPFWVFFALVSMLSIGLIFEWNNTAFEWLA